MKKHSDLLILAVLSVLNGSYSIPLDQFFLFGYEAGDTLSNLSDDGSVAIQLNTEFVFYDTSYTMVYLNNNGDISFNYPFGQFYPEPFPISTPLIAPFWSDLDTYYYGAVWYRVTTNIEIIQRVRGEVSNAFPELITFSATEVLIATWDDVGYCCDSDNRTVTFQCILATNGTHSFVIFLYSDGEINPRYIHFYDYDYYDYDYDITAQVGLNAGNQDDFLTVECSLTLSIYNIDENSNVNEPGKFVFQVNEVVRGEPGSGMECNDGSGSESISVQFSLGESGLESLISSGSGSQPSFPETLFPSCTSSCNTQLTDAQYQLCCDPINYGNFIQIKTENYRTAYLVCSSKAADWCI